MHKAELIDLLRRRGLLDLTVSCWNAAVVEGAVIECGECANCLEKRALIDVEASS